MREKTGNEQLQCLTPPENAAIIASLYGVEAQEKKLAHQVIGLQIAVILMVTAITLGINGTSRLALAVLSGGGISVVNGALLAWRMSRAAKASVQNAHQLLRLMYFYAAERFLLVTALLGLCMAVLKMTPLALLSGFVVGQAVLLTARLFLIRNKV